MFKIKKQHLIKALNHFITNFTYRNNRMSILKYLIAVLYNTLFYDYSVISV